jgi:hypothetical protein
MTSGLTDQELLLAQLACLQRIEGALQDLARSGVEGLDTLQGQVAETMVQVHRDLLACPDRN